MRRVLWLLVEGAVAAVDSGGEGGSGGGREEEVRPVVTAMRYCLSCKPFVLGYSPSLDQVFKKNVPASHKND